MTQKILTLLRRLLSRLGHSNEFDAARCSRSSRKSKLILVFCSLNRIFAVVMKSFKDLVQLRRSHRKFTDEPVDAEHVRLIMRAALMAPTSKSGRTWQFFVVDDRSVLERLADAKSMGSQFLKGAPLAIVVAGDGSINDCWIEDCSIAAISMQYQAEELGLGSCWIQMRGRGLTDGTSAQTVIQGILGLPENISVLCVIALGHPADERKPQNEDRLKWENVRIVSSE